MNKIAGQSIWMLLIFVKIRTHIYLFDEKFERFLGYGRREEMWDEKQYEIFKAERVVNQLLYMQRGI